MAPDRLLVFDPRLLELGPELSRFANHSRRLVRAAAKHRSILLEAARWSEGQAPMEHAPDHPAAAMRAIDQFARSRREDRAKLVGAYFAHHHLRMQAELSRALLRRGFGDEDQRAEGARLLYAGADEDRRVWIASLLELAISAAAPSLSLEDYAAFNVGSLTDHEDVDLAFVVASEEARTALARGFAKVSKTFLAFASRIQLFLTEQFATPRTGALVEEYGQHLLVPGRHVVAATQLLGAQLLTGSPRLARALDDAVTRRFYAGQGSPLVHEAYLRSVMSEIRHFLLPQTAPGRLSPKREVYVPAKLAIAAARVIHGVHEPRPLHALALLAAADPPNAAVYATLERAFVENELLRALLFLYVAPGDDLDLTDPTQERALRRVSVLLGLGRAPRATARTRLAAEYSELRARALRSVASLSLMMARHLGRVSKLKRLLDTSQDIEAPNLAVELLSTLESYKGSVFWDEVVELLGSRGTGRRFLADLARLPAAARGATASRLLEMMCEDAASLVELLVFVHVEGRDAELDALFFRELMRVLEGSAALRELLTERLDSETKSEALYRLARVYPAPWLAGLADLLEAAADPPKSARVARAIRSVMILVHHSSNALERISGRVLARAPDFIQRLGETRRLQELSSALLAEAAAQTAPRAKLELLGDAFDVAALRAALSAVLEGAPDARDVELTQAVDGYVRSLFEVCFEGVASELPGLAPARAGAGIAIYATGGYGRGEGFGADWDQIAVVDRTGGPEQVFYGKVLQRVSAAMARRGLPTHNRFAGVLDAYAVGLDALERHLETRGTETFIDEAEVLEARFILGDPEVHRAFSSRIAERIAGRSGRALIRDLVAEVHDRRTRPPRGINLKLGPGGLREIHLVWLAIRVEAALPGPLVPGLLALAERAFPGHEEDLRGLMVASEELRRARDLYRLVVAIDDEMEPELLVEAARDLAPLRRAGFQPGLREVLVRRMAEVAERIDRVVLTLERRVAGE